MYSSMEALASMCPHSLPVTGRTDSAPQNTRCLILHFTATSTAFLPCKQWMNGYTSPPRQPRSYPANNEWMVTLHRHVNRVLTLQTMNEWLHFTATSTAFLPCKQWMNGYTSPPRQPRSYPANNEWMVTLHRHVNRVLTLQTMNEWIHFTATSTAFLPCKQWMNGYTSPPRQPRSYPANNEWMVTLHRHVNRVLTLQTMNEWLHFTATSTAFLPCKQWMNGCTSLPRQPRSYPANNEWMVTLHRHVNRVLTLQTEHIHCVCGGVLT